MSMFVYYQCIIMYYQCIFPGKGREALRQSLTTFRFLTIGRELQPTAAVNYMKFTESAPMASNLEVNPVNSRKNTANNTNSTPFAQHIRQITRNSRHLQTTDKKSYALLTHIAHILLHIFHMYAHILHHCRLVLRTYNFTIETVFYIKCMCILSNTNSFRTNCTH